MVGGILDTFRVRLVSKKTKDDRSVELAVPPLDLSGDGWETTGFGITYGQWLNQWCLCNEPSIKTLNDEVGELAGWCTREAAGWVAHPLPIYLAQCISFIWLFLSYILHNKQVRVSKVFSWVLWVVLEHNQTWGRSQKPPIYTQLVRSTDSKPGPVIGVWSGAGLLLLRVCVGFR